jgi:hypothetical protein
MFIESSIADTQHIFFLWYKTFVLICYSKENAIKMLNFNFFFCQETSILFLVLNFPEDNIIIELFLENGKEKKKLK